MFSSSLVISAASGELIATVRSKTAPYSRCAAAVAAALLPPTTFGIARRGVVVLPGSSRSGEKATRSSAPSSGAAAAVPARSTLRPLSDSSIGTTSSFVVPGQVVLSSTISCPAHVCGASASTVCVMKLMSLRPAFSVATLSASTSKPVTRKPDSANNSASGRPT
jgi:hypothetical protein